MGLGPPSTLRRTADSIDCDKSTIACNRRWRLSLGPLPYVPSFNDLRDLLTPKPKRSSLLPRGRKHHSAWRSPRPVCGSNTQIYPRPERQRLLTASPMCAEIVSRRPIRDPCLNRVFEKRTPHLNAVRRGASRARANQGGTITTRRIRNNTPRARAVNCLAPIATNKKGRPESRPLPSPLRTDARRRGI